MTGQTIAYSWEDNSEVHNSRFRSSIGSGGLGDHVLATPNLEQYSGVASNGFK